MQVLWLDRAVADLDKRFDFLVARSPQAALRIHEAIRNQVAVLADHPGTGRPGRVADTRELVIVHTPYLVAYTYDPHVDAVIVLRVLHGARRWPEQFSTPQGDGG
jgi:plasmid stabilization system protein ParE